MTSEISKWLDILCYFFCHIEKQMAALFILRLWHSLLQNVKIDAHSFDFEHFDVQELQYVSVLFL